MRARNRGGVRVRVRVRARDRDCDLVVRPPTRLDGLDADEVI